MSLFRARASPYYCYDCNGFSLFRILSPVLISRSHSLVSSTVLEVRFLRTLFNLVCITQHASMAVWLLWWQFMIQPIHQNNKHSTLNRCDFIQSKTSQLFVCVFNALHIDLSGDTFAHQTFPPFFGHSNTHIFDDLFIWRTNFFVVSFEIKVALFAQSNVIYLYISHSNAIVNLWPWQTKPYHDTIDWSIRGV